jgi:single-strand DNA-binding protein
MASRSNPAPPGAEPRNEVVLCGRVAAAPLERELPSGDVIVTARIVVDRDPQTQGKSTQRVDTIDCVAWTGRVQRSMRLWEAGHHVLVEGSIRRRFFRAANGPVSRFEVEVSSTRRFPARVPSPSGGKDAEPSPLV